MVTTSEAFEFVEANYNYESAEGGPTVRFEFDNGAAQLVMLTITDKNIQFMAPFAKTEDVTAKQVLEGSNGFYLGVQLWGDAFAVVHYLNLANIAVDEIAQGILMSAHVAHNFKKKLHLEHQEGLWGKPDPLNS